MPLTYRFDKRLYLKMSDSVLEAILDAVEKTMETGKEAGFYICGTRDKNYPGPLCVEEECQIGVTLRDCKYSPQAGNFHTHPPFYSSMPSAGDLVSALLDYKPTCIYGPADDMVCCYKPKQEAYKDVKLHILTDKVNEFIKRYSDWRRRIGERYLSPTWEEYREYEEIFKFLEKQVTRDCWELKYVKAKKGPYD